MKTSNGALILSIALICPVGGADMDVLVDTHTKRLVEQFRNRTREIDPFGCAMNPATKAAIVVEAPPLPKEEAVRTPLQIALQKLMINGVNPNAKTVLVGARRLKVGEQFVFKHNGTNLRLILNNVTLKGIDITDLDTGEKAFHELAIAPNLQCGEGEAKGSSLKPFQGPLTIR
jgi:hypothetical protein